MEVLLNTINGNGLFAQGVDQLLLVGAVADPDNNVGTGRRIYYIHIGRKKCMYGFQQKIIFMFIYLNQLPQVTLKVTRCNKIG